MPPISSSSSQSDLNEREIFLDHPEGEQRVGTGLSDAPPRLSVMIITFNRAIMLESCLSHFCSQIARRSAGEIEIIVSDNHSTDHTEKLTSNYASRYPFVRYHRPARPLLSAEANFFSAIDQCRGEYIWPFSDEDYIAFGAVDRALELLASHNPAIMLVNSAQVNTDVAARPVKSIKIHESPLTLRYADLVKDVGLITLAASFSSTIFCRTSSSLVNLAANHEASARFSHVIFYLREFARKNALIVDEQLVTMRAGGENKTCGRLLRGERVPKFFHHTIGLSRQLLALMDDSILDRNFIFSVLECDKGDRFWTWTSLLISYLDWLKASAISPDDCWNVSYAEFLEFRSLFFEGDNYSFEILVRVDTLVRLTLLAQEIRDSRKAIPPESPLARIIVKLNDPSRQQMHAMLVHRISTDVENIRRELSKYMNTMDPAHSPVLMRRKGYKVSRFGGSYYALMVPSPDNSYLKEARYVDPESRPGRWLARRDLGLLLDAMDVGVDVKKEVLSPPTRDKKS